MTAVAYSLPDQPTIVPAWLGAVSYLNEKGSVYDLSFTVEHPQRMTAGESQVVISHDNFLRQHNSSVSTVSNTIFPLRLYKMHGYPKFLGQFDSINNRLKESGSWGSYFQRLAAGKYSGQRPIEVIINKMRKQLSKESGAFGRIYEWSAPLYDPSLDCGRVVRQPCLSHISFKLIEKTSLRVTAIYRSHYYNAKLLGNLIGLRDLQRFVCEQVEIEPGPLTIFSTYAVFDHDGWSLADAKQMLSDARSAYACCTTH